MKIMIVVGARPNFMKAAPIVTAVREHNSRDSLRRVHHTLVHTGQHYDRAMSGSFFAELGLPEPDYNLGVGSGSHAVQTAEVMRAFEEVLLRERPDVLIVVGDVNSTIACALVAAKISYDASGARPLIAHVEAGLRSFDRSMPEEINRILTDQLSDLLFTTEESAHENLAREGVPPKKIHFVGNTMIDSLMACRVRAAASTILADLGLTSRRYALLTLHRPANVDSPEALSRILAGLDELAAGLPIIFPMHPRTKSRMREFSLEDRVQWPGSGVSKEHGIHGIEPLGYTDFLALMQNAALVLTDSGGIQEETTCVGVPCVTVRENTERPVTVFAGTNVLAGVSTEGIRAAIRRQKQQGGTTCAIEKWDGAAAERIVAILLQTCRPASARDLEAKSSCQIANAYVRN